jgi:two-component system response regulator MtrA
MPQSILICEDDMVMSDMLQTLLRQRGHHVHAVQCGSEALEQVRQNPPALLILDLMLPDMDGYDVIRRLRVSSPLPVIMISGRAGEIDRIIGLELGADDYLVKPFGLVELSARIDAHIRRATQYAEGDPHQVIEISDLRLDLDAHQVSVDGRETHLTPKEFELLSALAEHRGSVVRSSQLLMRVWGYDSSIRTRTLDVHIGRLRAKIEQDTRRPRYILTVPGVGYKLRAPEAATTAA